MCDGTVQNAAIIGGSSYSIFRRDRSEFDSHEEGGGGIAMFINNGIQYEIIDIPEKTSLEIQALSVKFFDHFFLIVNLYMPPGASSLRLKMMKELGRSIHMLRAKMCNHQLIIVGDFN